MHIGDQDKPWSPHFCSWCYSTLFREWIKMNRTLMPFAIKMNWREPRNHVEDFYFCMTRTAKGICFAFLHSGSFSLHYMWICDLNFFMVSPFFILWFYFRKKVCYSFLVYLSIHEFFSSCLLHDIIKIFFFTSSLCIASLFFPFPTIQSSGSFFFYKRQHGQCLTGLLLFFPLSFIEMLLMKY